MSSEPDMKLPDGRTCSDCAHFPRCVGLFGCKPESTSCDWSPSRFVEAPGELAAWRKRAIAAEKRISELHEAMVRITRETPYPEEAEENRKRVGLLMAEVGTLKARAEAAEAERDHLRGRETYFAKQLRVSYGGQYRADWDSAIAQVIKERDEAWALLAKLRTMNEDRTVASTAFWNACHLLLKDPRWPR